MTVPVENTALIVVDMQKAFLDNQYSFGQIGMDVTPLQDAIPGCIKLVNMARAAGVPVIFTRYVYHPGMVDFGLHKGARGEDRLKAETLAFGTEEIEVIDELDPRPDDLVIDKSRPSSFYGTRLEPLLTSMGIRNLVVCGVTTNICVETTVRDAGQRDYGTFVVEDAVAEFTPERNKYALIGMGWSFGEVIKTTDVAEAWMPQAEAAE
ncbi:cysteine hydrolase family protein [Pseudooceanicola sp. MF1-13]|uniref:cysteine hydrolase family protein n=1 Tax=Pseudooceanicola sp. MF1-13 TaxID=3379095 RepID=UPI0038924E2D